MNHIARLIEELAEEGIVARLVVDVADGEWRAAVYGAKDDLSKPTMMLDRNGERFLGVYRADSAEDAVSQLDTLCAVGETS